MTAIVRPARLLAQIWALALVALLGTELLSQEAGLRIAVQVLYAGPLVIWAIVRLRGPRNLLDVVIVAALGALTVAAFTGQDRQGGLETVGLATAYALTFWFLRDGIDAGDRTRFAIAGSYAFTGWIIAAAIFWILEKVDWLRGTGSLPGLESAQVFVWGTTNVFPILVLLAAACLAWQPASRARSALIGLLLAASLVVIPFSNGRAGWLGLVVALVAWEAFGGWPHVRAASMAAGGIRPGLRRAAAVVGLGLTAVGLLLGGPSLVNAAQASLGDRFTIWGQALAIFTADPLTGGGPSTYSWLRLTHVPDHTYAVPVRLAHDVPLQTLADGGLLLAAGFGVLIVIYLASVRRRMREPQVRATVAVLLGIGTASLLDDFSSLPAVMVAIIALAAWSSSTPQDSLEAGSSWRRWMLPAGVALIGAIALPAVIGANVARVAAADGRVAAVIGDWPAAERAFAAATAAYPEQAGYWLGLGLASAEAGDEEGATAAFMRARDRSPGDARPYGALTQLTDDPGAKVSLLEDAAARTTSDPQYAWRLAETLRDVRRPDEAMHAYARALVLEPQLVTALPTDLHDMVRGDVPVAVSDMARRNPSLLADPVVWDLGLATDRLPPDAGGAWRAVDAARSSDGAAVDAALADLRANGIEGIELAALAAVARYQCDRDAYEPIAKLLGDFRPGRLAQPAITRDHTYRDLGLGSYQPGPYSLPADEPWPWSLVGEPPECPGWP